MFNKLKSIKKRGNAMINYQIEKMPDFFDNIDRITKSFDPLLKSAIGVENEKLLITTLNKCVDFCIEAEKIKAYSYYTGHNTAEEWRTNIKNKENLNKE